jgi:ribosomal protein S8
MTAMKHVLSEIRNGNTVSRLAREMDVNTSTLLALIDFLVHEGYLEQASMNNCTGCGSNCHDGSCESEIKIYALTSKGVQYIT